MLPPGDCPTGPSICCDSLYLQGASILNIALLAINNPDCYVSECDAPNMDGIVTIGRGVGYLQPDLMLVSMQSLNARSAPAAKGSIQGPTKFMANWQIQFIESGWLTFEDLGGDEVGAPDPGIIEMLAAHSYSHAELVYRALFNAGARHQIDTCGDGCFASMGDLVPLEPSGHRVGWSMSMTVPVDLQRPCDAS